MIRSYLTLAMRRLKRQPGYTFINVAGLAIGMVACLLIGLYIRDELSFDRFHTNADKLYTATNYGNFWGESLYAPYRLASFMTNQLPVVQATARTAEGSEVPVMREETNQRSNWQLLFGEPSFFELFSFPATKGDPALALATPDGAVITASMADVFFGSEDPIGKPLRFPRFGSMHDVTVRAVVADVPRNSTIRFDIIIPLTMHPGLDRMRDSWGSFAFRTYAVTRQEVDPHVLESGLEMALARHFEEADGDQEPPAFHVRRLSSTYLSGLLGESDGFRGDWKYLYIFGSVAAFLLIIGAVNYVNLVTAQATQRAREVGVRKAMGAGHGQLARQFLGESVLLSFSALGVAIVMTVIALPAFNQLFGKQLSLAFAGTGWVILLICCFVLMVAVAAGAYPALALSSYRPTDVLRGSGPQSAQSRGRALRKGLVVLQFTISVVLIAGTAIIYRQLDFVQTTDLGFDGEQVVVVEVPSPVPEEALSGLKDRVLSHAGVLRASVANGLPGKFPMTFGEEVVDIAPDAPTEAESVQFKPAVVDYDFLETLGISVQEGRGFSRDFPSDLTRGYMLNEKAVSELGWTAQEAVGKTFTFPSADTVPEGTIIGVVENFHIVSLHSEIEPVVLHLSEDPRWSSSFALIAKLAPDRIRPALDHLADQFGALAPGEPFVYEFLDERFDAMYRSEQQLSRIFTTFAAIAIFIACLGLFGLAAFTAQRRTKEIGIRKVLGASVSNIVALLSKDFLVLVVVAFVIAIPLTIVLMNRWLQDFAYRIELGPEIFLLVGLIALGIAIATVSYHSIRAATADPATSLRYE